MKSKEKIFLLLIVILGLYFRLNGINFDETCCQHPDERAIVMFTTPISFPKTLDQFLSPQSPLNTHFFAYGNLPLYILKGLSVIVGQIDAGFMYYSKINLIGRGLSVFADLATIVILFFLGRNLFGKRIGLAASLIYSLSTLPIQYSHFYTVDIILTTFILFTILRIVIFYKNPTIPNAILVGISFGLSLATKISATPLLAAITTALVVDFLFIFLRKPHKPSHWLPDAGKFVKLFIRSGLIIVTTIFLTYIIVQPYALIDSTEFLKQNLLQSQMTHNAYIFPYTLQYVGKIPYLHEIKNLFFWGLGPIISLLVFLGMILILTGLKKRPLLQRNLQIIVLSFFFIYFLVVGKFAVGFMRYLLPIYPLFALFAGVALVFIIELFEIKRNLPTRIVLKSAVMILLLLWPISFMSVYGKTNTRIEASNWVLRNIPYGSIVAVEHWDDKLPLINSNFYNYNELTLYDQPDNQQKWDLLSSKINSADYIIIASNRLYAPIQKLNDCSKFLVCYPITSRFYEELFSEKLGFKKIAEFSSYPTVPLINATIVDDSADESFTVYDHPKIMIYKNTIKN